MLKPAPFVLAIACALACACGGDSPTAPSAEPDYNGQWSGTTLQGRPVAFTVSSNHVTAITVGYSFGGCSGSKTFANLNVEIFDVSGPGGQTTPNLPKGFAYGSGAPDGSSVQLQGFLRYRIPQQTGGWSSASIPAAATGSDSGRTRRSVGKVFARIEPSFWTGNRRRHEREPGTIEVTVDDANISNLRIVVTGSP